MRRRVPKRHRPESFGVLYHPALPHENAKRDMREVLDKLAASQAKRVRQQQLEINWGW